MKKSEAIFLTLFLLWMLFAIVVLMTSCSLIGNVKKTHTEAKRDSVAVAKVDSTHVVKADAGHKNDSTWWRETILYGRDTTIYNSTVTTPVNNYYPTQVIREGGTVNKEDWLRMIDSANKAKVDSTKVQTKEESSSKKTSPNLPLIIGLCFLGYLILDKGILSRFKLIKK